jgi:hypothetical protein
MNKQLMMATTSNMMKAISNSNAGGNNRLAIQPPVLSHYEAEQIMMMQK